MSELLAIGCALLIVIAIGPLVLLLCLWLVGDRLGHGVESRLLDAAGGAVDVAMVGRNLGQYDWRHGAGRVGRLDGVS